MTETPSISVTSTETENDSLSELEGKIKKFDMSELVNFLQKVDRLKLIEEDFNIIKNERINGLTFLKITKEELCNCGMKVGPAISLTEFVKWCKKKLRAFSSYLSLDEVLKKYDLSSDGIHSIPLFTPKIHKIQDDNKTFKRCIKEILGRLRTYRALQPDSLESIRNEYVVAILHAAIHIVMDETNNEKLTIRPQYGVVGDKSKGRVDFAIKVK